MLPNIIFKPYHAMLRFSIPYTIEATVIYVSVPNSVHVLQTQYCYSVRNHIILMV